MSSWVSVFGLGKLMTDEQQTEQSPIPSDDYWIAQIWEGKGIHEGGGPKFLVFNHRTWDNTYDTEAEAQRRIDYIKNGGDGW